MALRCTGPFGAFLLSTTSSPVSPSSTSRSTAIPNTGAGDVDVGDQDSDGFTISQQDGNRVMGLAGAGLDVAFMNGVTAKVDYDGQLSRGGDQHAVIAGVRL